MKQTIIWSSDIDFSENDYKSYLQDTGYTEDEISFDDFVDDETEANNDYLQNEIINTLYNATGDQKYTNSTTPCVVIYNGNKDYDMLSPYIEDCLKYWEFPHSNGVDNFTYYVENG